MLRILTALVAVFLCAPAAFAPRATASHAWELDAMNRTIDATNFIVDDRCSGTLIDLERRLVLTNWHCVRHRISKVSQERVGADGVVREIERMVYRPVPVSQKAYAGFEEVGSSSYATDIVAQDETADLALLQIKAARIPHDFATQLLPPGVDVMRGEVVYAVGNPALLDASVTVGIVSNLARRIRVGGVERSYLQMSAPIFGGNSGGALYNDQGQLIGIPAAAAAGGGALAFAIRIDTIRAFLSENCFGAVHGGENAERCAADVEGR